MAQEPRNPDGGPHEAQGPGEPPSGSAPERERGGYDSEADESSPFDELVARLLTEPLNVPVLADAVEQQEAADAADTLEDMAEDDAADVLVEMEAQAAADALAEMEKPMAVLLIDDVIDEGDFPYAGKLLQLMAPDDAVDLLQAMDEAHREQLLAHIPSSQAAKLRRLIRYAPDSAGGIMTTDFIVLRRDMTVAQATGEVRRRTVPEEVQYLPVVDEQEVLAGLVSLRDLLLHQPQERVADFMSTNVDTLRWEMDREQVAREFDRYDYAMMPVVDAQNRLLGIITFDDVIDIIRREQTEDVQKTVGAGPEEAVYDTLPVKVRSRFPWLLVNLFTSSVAALVVLQFDDLISELAILAVLMPVIANQAGNAGQQSLAVTLRGIVLDQVRSRRVLPLLLREAGVGAINGVIGGLLVGAGLAIFSEIVHDASWKLGVVAGIAMAASLALGCFVGSTMPIVMRRAGFDPATGSTIFLTMTTDSVSFLTFLGLARVLSRWLLG